jgi:cyclophilin family peptidyl-prolyl cis-trans isomerase
MRLHKLLIWIGLTAGMASAQEPELLLDAVTPSNPQVRIITNLGGFVIELDKGRAPLTVENFLSYVESGHYEGTIFHRVIQGFVAQTGGFTANFEEKPKPDDGIVINESGNGLSNIRGSIGLARGNEPHGGSAQFYINLTDNTDLNPRPTRWGYAVFGKIVEGMDIADQIGHVEVGPGGEFDRDVPLQHITIESAELINE